MLPPAPGLFSITTDWPQTSCRRLPIRRAVMSVEPPGGNGTTMRTDRCGQSAPAARDGRMGGAAMAAAARPTKRRRFSMDALPPGVIARLARVVGCEGVWGEVLVKSMRRRFEAQRRLK